MVASDNGWTLLASTSRSPLATFFQRKKWRQRQDLSLDQEVVLERDGLVPVLEERVEEVLPIRRGCGVIGDSPRRRGCGGRRVFPEED